MVVIQNGSQKCFKPSVSRLLVNIISPLHFYAIHIPKSATALLIEATADIGV